MLPYMDVTRSKANKAISTNGFKFSLTERTRRVDELENLKNQCEVSQVVLPSQVC